MEVALPPPLVLPAPMGDFLVFFDQLLEPLSLLGTAPLSGYHSTAKWSPSTSSSDDNSAESRWVTSAAIPEVLSGVASTPSTIAVRCTAETDGLSGAQTGVGEEGQSTQPEVLALVASR